MYGAKLSAVAILHCFEENEFAKIPTRGRIETFLAWFREQKEKHPIDRPWVPTWLDYKRPEHLRRWKLKSPVSGRRHRFLEGTAGF